jgi:hypothetical protein
LLRRLTWTGDAFEHHVLKAMKEIEPASLAPKTPEAEALAKLEADLATVRAKLGREEHRLEAAEDEAAEEVAHKRLEGLVRQRCSLERDIEACGGRLSCQPRDNVTRLHGLLGVLEGCPEEELAATRAMIKALVKEVVVYVQRRGKYDRRCWAWLCYADGRWRRVFISEAGWSVTQEGEGDIDFTALAAEGWD